MFYPRLMGLTDDCYGEIIQQEDDETWMSDRGVIYKLVKPDLCLSSRGVYYWPLGDIVTGGDGSQFVPIQS